MKALFFMFLLVLCRRVREAGEVRAQTEARVQVMSLAYSSVYGNKVTKLQKPYLRQTIFGMILRISRCESCGRTWPRVISSPLQVMTSKTPTSARSDSFYVCTKGSTLKSLMKCFEPKLCTIWWAVFQYWTKFLGKCRKHVPAAKYPDLRPNIFQHHIKIPNSVVLSVTNKKKIQNNLPFYFYSKL